MHKAQSELMRHGLRPIGGFRTRLGRRTPKQGRLGPKERARHAGKPDGLMHTPTPGLRSNDAKRKGLV